MGNRLTCVFEHMANVETASHFIILYAGFFQHFPGVILQNFEDFKTSYNTQKTTYFSYQLQNTVECFQRAFKEPEMALNYLSSFLPF